MLVVGDPYGELLKADEEVTIGNVTFNSSSSGSSHKDSKELQMSQSEWVTAWALFLRVLSEFRGRRAYSAANLHFNDCLILIGEGYAFEAIIDYDVRQRKLYANDSTHDMGTRNSPVLESASKAHSNKVIAAAAAASTPSFSAPRINRNQSIENRRERVSARGGAPPPIKAAASCFRCGFEGHVPKDCSRTVTRAGKPVAPLTGGSHQNSIQAPDGKPFCFNFCKYGNCRNVASCPGNHSCSICSGGHGASTCPN